MDTAVLGQVLSALPQGAGGQAGQQARTALAALAGRLPGRQAAETRAVEAANYRARKKGFRLRPGRPFFIR